MLADERANAIAENFAGQWLYLRNLQSAAPDGIDFSDWDDNLRQAFATETKMFFGNIVRDDRNVLELLTADYAFVNERLARLYGIPNVYGPRFRRVAVPDSNRRGLLGQGSILTVTSTSNRTSLVNRGKWVLAGVVECSRRLRRHRASTQIFRQARRGRRDDARPDGEASAEPTLRRMSCTDGPDRPGFGKFRRDRSLASHDDGSPIDAAVTVFNGDSVSGPVGLRDALLKRSDVIVETITRKLMTYALARGVEAGDMPAVRGVVGHAARQNFRFSAIVLGIVKERAVSN